MQSVWESARAVASEEAMRSSLPGYFEGPADAARHIIGTAELRRRAGFAFARTIPRLNEWWGEASNHGPELTAMDLANNAIGFAIGAKARSYAEVVAMAREAIQRGIANGGTGEGGTPTWLPSQRWREPRTRAEKPPHEGFEWRQREPGGGTYAFGGAEHGFFRGLTPRETETKLLEDLAVVPPEAWSESDVRAVIRSRPYQDSRDPTRAAWHERVRAYFEARRADENAANRDNTRGNAGASGEQDDGTEVVNVRAYDRQGQDGPVHVSAHQRSAPG